jgi:hypothetical protein
MAQKSKLKFLAPLFEAIPTRLVVITTPAEFYEAQDLFRVPYGERQDWPNTPERIGASTMIFPSSGLVALALGTDVDAGVVVHESVHIFEAIMRDIGEPTPSEEFRAYGTEAIFRAVWEEFLAKGVDKPKTEG